MKRLLALIFLMYLMIVVLLFVVNLTGCSKPDPNPNPKEVAFGLLMSGTWKLNNLMIDNVDYTNSFKDLTLSFSESTYSTVNAKPPVWPAGGTWLLIDQGKSMMRDEVLPISIDELTKDKLVITFNWTTTYGSGRNGSVGGKNVFTFGK